MFRQDEAGVSLDEAFAQTQRLENSGLYSSESLDLSNFTVPH